MEGYAELEGHLLTKEHRLIPYHWTGALLKNTHGEPIGITGIGRDVSDKKRAEEALQVSEGRLSSFIMNSPSLVFSKSQDGRYLFANPEFERMFHLSAGHIIGKTDYEVFPPEQADQLVANDRRVCQEGHHVKAEETARYRDGIHTSLVTKFPLRNADGSISGLGGIVIDITERKRAETALRESEERYRTLVDLSPNGVLVYSNGKKVYVNQAACRIMGAASPEQLLDNPTVHFSHPDAYDSIHASIAQILATGEPVRRVERKYQRLDGTAVFVEVDAGRIMWNGEPAVQVIFADITERKWAEEERQKQEVLITLMLNTGPACIKRVAVDGSLLQMNPTGLKLVEACGELEVVGRSVFDLIVPEHRDAFISMHRRVIEGHECMLQFEIQGLKGTRRWMESYAAPFRNPVTGQTEHLAVTHDITERKQAEEALRESEAFNISVLNSLSSQIVVLNSQGVIMAVNKPWLLFAEGNGAPHLAENFVGMNYLNVCAQAPLFANGEEADSAQAGILAVLAGTHNEFYLEYPCHSPDQQRWFRMRVTPLLNSQVGAVVAHENITERRQAEEALRKSEERYARATAVGKVGVWELDVAAGTYYGDPNLKGLFGYVGDELSTDPSVWLNLVHPDDRSIAMDHWQRIVNGETDIDHYELRMLKKDGMVIWTDVRGHAIRDHEGQVILLLGTTVDVTERKQAQDALVQSERQIHTVLDALPVGIWFTDRSGKPLLVNPMAEQIWSNIKQIEPQTPNNQSGWWDTNGPVSEVHRRALSHTLRTGVPSQSEILDFECLDGTKKVIRNSTVPVRDEAGVVLGAIVLNEDITALRQIQEALKLTQFSVDHAVEGFFWFGPDARILNVNEAACRLLEYTRDELTAMTVYDIDPNYFPELWPTQWDELKEKGSLTFETKYWSRTGRVLDMEVTVNYLQYEGTEYNCAIMRDIGERKRTQTELRASEERYRSLYDETPTMYFTLATDGTVRSVNRFGAEQLGYQAEELIGHSVLGFFHEEDKETVAANLSECLATPEIPRYWEFRKRRKDGTIIWVQETARVSQSSTGETVVLVTCEDITERKRAEQESHERIRQAAAMQTALLELAHLDDISLTFSTILQHVTCIVADVLAVERVSLWLLSRDQTELVCQDLYLRSQATHSTGSRLAASSYPRYLAVLKESLVIGASNARVDQRTSEFTDDYFLSLGITSVLDVPIRRQGKVIGVLWCEHVGMPREWAPEVQDFGVSVGQTIARMIEASERRRAEVSLRQSEERYRSLVDNAPIGIFVIEAGRFGYANREMQRILNATRAEQLLGMPILDRIAPEFHTVVKDRIHQLMEKGQPVPSLDSQYVRLDGSRIDVAVTAIPTSFDGTDVIQVLVLDIAERKRGEQEQARLIEDLTRSQQHFQALFNWTPSAVGISTVAEGRFIDVNEGFSRLTGYMREELMGRTTLELGLWADVSERESVLREILEQGYLHNREGLLQTKSGEIRSLMVSVESIQLGPTPCLIYLCHDITERKQAEEALRLSEERFRAVFENAAVGIAVGSFTTGTGIDQINPVFAAMLGYTQEELCHLGMKGITFPDDLPASRELVSHLIGGTRSHETIEKRYVKKDGSLIWAQTTVSSILDKQGNCLHLIALIQDITERKQAEEALRKKDLELDHYFTSALDLLCIADVTGRFKRLNKAWESTLGYLLEELEGAKFLDYVHPDDMEATLHALGDLAEQKEVPTFVNRYRRKDGSYRWIEWKSIQDGELIYASARDITERKRMEDALRMRERELQVALQERERISQDLHDGILQSLFAVGLTLEVAKSLMPPKTLKASSASLNKAIDQLNRVMREIRNFIAGLDSESLEGKNLPAALKHLLKSLTENQPTRVRFAVEDRAAKALSAEQSLHLLRVIQEAVSNCIRHGGAQEARVSLKMLKQGVRLSIRDNGRGFNQDTVKAGGYGLRNMAARAQKVSGRFTVLSKENEGTRIILDLPKEVPHFPR
ncbi:MAG: PAS domain S-box protein [Nitrospirota bacterium]